MSWRSKRQPGNGNQEVKTFLDATLAERQSPRLPKCKLSKAADALAWLETVEKGRSPVKSTRRCAGGQLAWFADRAKWEGLQSVGLVESTREIKGRRTVERRYYLSACHWGWKPLRGRCATLGD